MSSIKNFAEKALHAYPTLYCRSKSMRADSPMAFILDSLRVQLRKNLSRMSFPVRTLVVFIWPPFVVLAALGLTVANGRFTARRHHRGIVQQFVDQIRLAFADGVPPIFYYLYELHDPRNYRRAYQYIHRAYVKRDSLYACIYKEIPEKNARAKLLTDKLAFYRFYRERGLPTVPAGAVVEGGVFSWTNERQQELPHRDLFIKLRKGKGGRGAERWIYRDGTYAGPTGRVLDAQELTDHLAALSRSQPRLVQGCLVNHPELRELTAGALSTLRMYTFWNESGAVEHVFTMFRMSQTPDCPVDNVHSGGLAAAVDASTGELGRATDSGMLARTGWLERHPVTGAQIAGRKLPFWREAVDLVISAHRQLPEAFVVGWDVAITEDGPILVEGNKSPDIEIEQRLSGPWGNERYGQLLAYHLKKAIEDRRRQRAERAARRRRRRGVAAEARSRRRGAPVM